MPQGVLAVRGLSQFMVALGVADRQTKKMVVTELRGTGEAVRQDAAAFMSRINGKTAAGFRVRVRQRGVAVAQSVRKTTGKHPEYGSLQMRVLARAVSEHADDTERAMERAMDRICDRLEAGPVSL
jgi:hypothetical protein